MTEPDEPATTTAKATEAATRKAPNMKATAAKPELAPKVTDKGRLDHTSCGYLRDLKGRAACRTNHAKSAAEIAKRPHANSRRYGLGRHARTAQARAWSSALTWPVTRRVIHPWQHGGVSRKSPQGDVRLRTNRCNPPRPYRQVVELLGRDEIRELLGGISR